MPEGTPGFIGKRLKEARESRSFTVAALAGLLGITRAAVYLYEDGTNSPQPQMLTKISSVLNVPITYFLKNIGVETEDTLFYRSMHSTSAIARISAKHRYKWLKKIILPYLREYVDLPKVNLPDFVDSTKYHSWTAHDIESFAASVRNYWKLGDGPISNVSLLVENNGIILSEVELDTPSIDSLSTWCADDGTPYLIINSERVTTVRKRFDIAHELGHLIMHRHLDGNLLRSAREFKLIEDQAHRFAGAFLIPSHSFLSEVNTLNLNELSTIKAKWLVSIAMLIKRSEDLGVIPESQVKRLWINYSRRGWRKQEPLDDSIRPEEPRLLQRAFNLIIDKHVQIPEQVITSLALSDKDVEIMANLPEGFFSKQFATLDVKEFLQPEGKKEYPSKLDKEIEDILNNYGQDKA